MTKTVYYNYLRTQSEETIKNLSFLRFEGRYQKNDDGWYYIYFEKEGEKLTVPQIGEVTNKFFRNLVGGEFLSDTKNIARLLTQGTYFSGEKAPGCFSEAISYSFRLKQFYKDKGNGKNR